MNGSTWQFEFGSLLWAIGLVVVPLLVFFARRSLVVWPAWRKRAWLGVRVLLLVALVGALCGPVVRTFCCRLYVVVAIDHSASVSHSARGQADRFADQALATQGNNTVEVLHFPQISDKPGENPEAESADAARPDDQAPRGKPPAAPNGPAEVLSHSAARVPGAQTDLAMALLASRAHIPADRPGRIVLLSDGNQTAGDVLRCAAGIDTPVDTVPLPGLPEPESKVVILRGPPRVRCGEACSFEMLIDSNASGRGRLSLYELPGDASAEGRSPVERRLLAQREVKIKPGLARWNFDYRAEQEGWCLLEATLTGAPDTCGQNNRARAALRVLPPPRVLLLGTDLAQDEPLIEALRADRLPVDAFPAEPAAESAPNNAQPHSTPAADGRPLPALEQYDLLILSNVPARLLSEELMERIAGYVESGGGLLVIGGDRSLTPGGYRGTRLEGVLPVECVARTDKPKPPLALLLVVDRSASMEGEKITLAREACARAVETLGPRDEVGILAFEDRATWLSPLGPARDRQAVLERIAQLQPGGSTNLYPAMHRAFLALRQSTAELKHMIILSDGISHPAPFAQLARQIAAQGITISTVAVGAESARELLAELAELGGGHYYYCDQPQALPQIFALEAARAAQTGITEEPFSPREPAGTNLISSAKLALPRLLLGFAETRARPKAEVLLETPGGHVLLARRRVGRGTSVVFTSDVHRRWAAAWRGQSGFGRFWSTLARWTIRPLDRPRGQLAIVDLEGRRVAALRWSGDQAARSTEVQAQLRVETLSPLREKESHSPAIPRITALGPRLLAARLPVAEGNIALEAELQWPDRVRETIFAGRTPGYAREFAFGVENRRLLRKLAECTGGRFDPKPGELFVPPAKGVPCLHSLGFYLLWGVVWLVLIDVVLKRWHAWAGRKAGKRESTEAAE